MIGKVICKIDRRPHCPNGWDATKRKPSCNYTGGHFCRLLRGHAGRCRCTCGATSTTDPRRAT